jgi:hypothetical protein
MIIPTWAFFFVLRFYARGFLPLPLITLITPDSMLRMELMVETGGTKEMSIHICMISDSIGVQEVQCTLCIK